jgi:hypothetical protein
MSKISDHPAVATVGVIAAAIAIFVFITGWRSIPDMFSGAGSHGSPSQESTVSTSNTSSPPEKVATASPSSPPTSISAEAPSSNPAVAPAYLSDMTPMEGSPIWDNRPADGQVSGHAIGENLPDCQTTTQTLSYDLQRKYQWLDGTVAESDDSRSSTAYEVQIVTDDGHIAYTKRISYGHSYRIHIRVRGVLRVALRATLLTGTGEECYFQGSVVWKDIQAS